MRVLKFGGKSLSTVEKINSIAKKIAEQVKSSNDHKLIIVVSAMGETTSELLGLSSEVKPSSPDTSSNRELDMLLASGERVSSALMALALQKNGIESTSFTGSQAGILTHGKHSDSSIKEIKPHRIDECIDKNIIPVIAGFQGVDPVTKDVTTLGRGGSDLTACALAHHYNCPAELYKTVGGVFNCDPSIVKEANLIKELDYNFMQSLSSWGGQVLHDKAASFIKENQTDVQFLSDESFKSLTKITSHSNQKNTSITCLDDVIAIKIDGLSIPDALSKIEKEFESLTFRVLASAHNDNDSRFLISTTKNHKEIFLNSKNISILNDSLNAVSLIFSEVQEQRNLSKFTAELNEFEIKRLLETPKRLTFFIDQTKKIELIKKLHSLIS